MIALGSGTAEIRVKKEMNAKAKRVFESQRKKAIMSRLLRYSAATRKDRSRCDQVKSSMTRTRLRRWLEKTETVRAIRLAGESIARKRGAKLVYGCFRKWTLAMKKRLLALYTMATHRSTHTILTTFCGWRRAVNRRRALRDIEAKIADKKRRDVLGVTWKGWIGVVKDPMKELRKMAAYFYLERTYKKCLSKFKAYVSNRRFRRSIDDYCRLRVMKRALREWTKAAQWKAYVRSCFLARTLAKRHQVLNALLCYTNARAEKHRMTAAARQHFALVAAGKTLLGLRRQLAARERIYARVEEISATRAAKTERTILVALNTVVRQSAQLNLNMRTYRDSAAGKRLRGAVFLWQYVAALNQKLRCMRAYHDSTVAARVLRLWKEWKSERLGMRERCQGATRLHRRGTQSRVLGRLRAAARIRAELNRKEAEIRRKTRRLSMRTALRGLKAHSLTRKRELGISQRIGASHIRGLLSFVLDRYPVSQASKVE